MRTAGAQRRRGVAARMMHHLMDAATRRGYARLSLETGSADAFAPARSLYARFGFRPCSPFGQYVDSPHSVFMTRALARADSELAGSRDAPLRPLASATPAKPARA
jgi:putative acetyltransferase